MSAVALVVSLVALVIALSRPSGTTSAQASPSTSATSASPSAKESASASSEASDTASPQASDTPSPEESSPAQSPAEPASNEWIAQEGSVLEGTTYSNVHFTITGLTVENNVATMTMDVTNQDSDNQTFYLLSPEVFQNGLQIGSLSSSDYPKLQPNASTTVTYQITLEDTTSPITIEIDDLGPHMDGELSITYSPAN